MSLFTFIPTAMALDELLVDKIIGRPRLYDLACKDTPTFQQTIDELSLKSCKG